MRNTAAIAQRILRQFRHDKRMVAAMVVAPVFIMWLLSLILTSDEYVPTVVCHGMPAEVQALYEDHAHVVADSADTDSQLRDGQIDAVITVEDGEIQVLLNGSDPAKTQAVMKATQEVMQDYRNSVAEDSQKALEQLPPAVAQQLRDHAPLISGISTGQIYGADTWKSYDYVGPTLVGIFLFVFTFISSQMAMVTERSQGTVERFLATAVKPWEVVAGYGVAFALTGSIQTLIITFMAVWVIGIHVVGSLWLALLIGLTIAVASVVMGLMASSLARTPLQVIQLMLLIVSPQILLCGVFSLAGAPRALEWISLVLPLRHGVDALKAVMTRAATIGQVAPQLGILWAMIALFFAVATVGMRKKRAR